MARPKNVTTIILEKKIAKLNLEIDRLNLELAKKIELEKQELSDSGELPYTAYGVIVDKRDYKLVQIMFNDETNQALVVKTEKIADSKYRADYELKKIIAYGSIFNKKKGV